MFLNQRGVRDAVDASNGDALSYMMDLKSRNMSKSTVNRKLASLRTYYDFLIKDGYIKVEAYDGFIVTPVGEESEKNNVLLTLNDTAGEIWDMLKEEKSADQIADALCEKYGIARETAKSDTKKIIDSLKKEGILTN